MRSVRWPHPTILLVVMLAVLTLGIAGCSAVSVTPPRSVKTPPVTSLPSRPRDAVGFAHVVLVIFENHARSQVIGSPAAPYLTGLARHGADFTDSFAIEHPSQPNYLDLFSGSNHGITDDSCPHALTSSNIAHQLLATHRSFVGYSEDLPEAGSAVCWSGGYARKHAPWTDFGDLPQRSMARPFADFGGNFAHLPTFAWVVPNLCDDMHDCPVSRGDAWAQDHLSAYAQWARAHDSLLIVTFDEDDAAADNHVATFFYGAHVRVGRYSQRIDHFTVLRTLEHLFGLPPLGAAALRAPIRDAFS